MKIKTNHVAYIILALVFIGMLLVAFGLATLSEVSTFGSMLAVLITALGFLLTADAPGKNNRSFTPNPDLDTESEELENLKK